PAGPALEARRDDGGRGHRVLQRAARDDASLAGLGPGQRNGSAREGLPGHVDAGLLRRPSLPVAATVQREHQPALPRVLAQGNRDPRSPALPHHDRGGDQQPSPPPARLPDTDRIIHSTTGRRAPCCFDALTPPATLGNFTEQLWGKSMSAITGCSQLGASRPCSRRSPTRSLPARRRAFAGVGHLASTRLPTPAAKSASGISARLNSGAGSPPATTSTPSPTVPASSSAPSLPG